ncbi:MAG: YMGG-like glycine zipper-containing protein [Hydrogenophilaceae bacterium]
MKSRYIAPSLLMASLIALASPVAMASDELAGALIGAGAGAILGHAIGGHDGAVVGGFLGAAVGASAADDDHRYYRSYRERPYVVYGSPRYYAPPPYWHGPRYTYRYWRHDRDGWRDRDRDHDRDGWRDRDRDRDSRHEGRGQRHDDGWDYRNW